MDNETKKILIEYIPCDLINYVDGFYWSVHRDNFDAVLNQMRRYFVYSCFDEKFQEIPLTSEFIHFMYLTLILGKTETKNIVFSVV